MVLSLLLVPLVSHASNIEGTIQNQYAWSSNNGWVNFGTTQGNVVITDTGLSGYAWGQHIGWINLAPSQGGVRNDGVGNLSGNAWGQNVGWINFSGVSINSSGKFLGSASGPLIGTLSFECSTCNVTTDWRQSSIRDVSGGGGRGLFVSETPNQPLALAINDGATQTNSRSVVLNLTAGSNVVSMAISRTADFSNASQESYQYTHIWDLCVSTQTVCAPGIYSVYVKYFTGTGASSAPIQATIAYTSDAMSAQPGHVLFTPTSTLPIIRTTSTPPELPLFQLPIINIIQPDSVVPSVMLLPKFLQNLSFGSRGINVKSLQTFLNINGFFVAKTGAGSLGKETAFFGAATRLALIKYQRAFFKEILGSKATLSQANGLFGPATRAYVNRLLVPLR